MHLARRWCSTATFSATCQRITRNSLSQIYENQKEGTKVKVRKSLKLVLDFYCQYLPRMGDLPKQPWLGLRLPRIGLRPRLRGLREGRESFPYGLGERRFPRGLRERRLPNGLGVRRLDKGLRGRPIFLRGE